MRKPILYYVAKLIPKVLTKYVLINEIEKELIKKDEPVDAAWQKPDFKPSSRVAYLDEQHDENVRANLHNNRR